MGKKFRLSVARKYEYQKTKAVRSLVVSIPLSALARVSISPERLPFQISWPLSVFTQSLARCLSGLQQRLSSIGGLPTDWVDVSGKMGSLTPSADQLTLCKFSRQDPALPPVITFSLNINGDFSWTLHLYDQELDTGRCSYMASVPECLATTSGVLGVLEAVEESKVCVGNPDERFSPLLESRKDGFKDSTGTKTVAYRDSRLVPFTTIRHCECEVLLPQGAETDRCTKCSNYRSSLRAMLSNEKHKQPSANRTHPSSHTRYQDLSTPEKIERMHRLQRLQQNTRKRLERLKAKLAEAVERNGTSVDTETHHDLTTIVKEQSPHIESTYPPESFQRVFWEQQKQATSCKDSRSMRWHPLMIKWCVYLRHLSSKAYETLRESGCVMLPSQRTLRDYTHYVKATVGSSSDVDKQLMETSGIQAYQEWQKCVALVLDEMHIKEELVYDKHTGALLGFINLGETNTHLLEFERSLQEGRSGSKPLANSMMVFMVRGLFTQLRFPYAQFSCGAVSGDLLYDPFWEAVCRLERCGFRVLAATADGASSNRRLIKLHGSAAHELVYKVVNPYATEERHLFFFSDPPHLLKTSRNCWASKKRHLWCEGKEISWKHLEDLYKRDRANKEAPGLALVPKLKYEHVYLTSFSKMRVDLAAQVLSDTVSKALQLTGGSEAEQTAHFIGMFDKFFDCFNVSSFNAGKRSRKAFKAPYRSPADFRLKWLKEKFLSYLEEWEKSVREREGYTAAAKKKMMISPETLLGLKMTVYSFLELVPYLFSLPGVKVFLSERLCQDPLEKFFGCQRQRSRVNENPNVRDFCKNTQALRVVNSCLDSVKGNCRGSKTVIDFEKENQPLPKRRN